MPSSLPATPASQNVAQPIPAATINNHRDNLNFLRGVPTFSVRYAGTAQSFASATSFTAIASFDTVDWDTDGMHAGTAGSLTCVTPGLWVLEGGIQWAPPAAAAGRCECRIRVNAADVTGNTGGQIDIASTSRGYGSFPKLTTRLAIGDVLTLVGQQNSGGALDTAGGVPLMPYLRGHWIAV